MSDADERSESWLAKLEAAKEERRLRFIEAREQSLAKGKEPFDLERLRQSITLKRPGDPRPDDEVEAEWEERYYLQHRTLETMEAFIDYYLPLEEWITPI
jgi:hypothetical protein